MSMLAGIRVIELGTTITAPLTAMLLSDLGADVIKVERPEGDPFRSFRGGSYSPHFASYNRGKRSVTIDLGTSEGKHDLIGLIGDADVLVDNYRPGVLDRLGIKSEELRAQHPTLIHCSITGFGASGPDRDRPAYDGVAQAMSGISSLFLDPEAPSVTGPTLSDNVTGMYAAYGILGALFERTRTGAGQRLEINMFEASMAFIPDAFATATMLGISVDPYSRASSSQSYAFRCADGPLVAIHISSLEKFWTGLLDALEAPEIGADERFAARMGRVNNYLALRTELQNRFATRPRSEWLERLRTAGIPFSAVNSIAEAMNEPQAAALGTFGTYTHPTQGPLTYIHNPILANGRRITPDVPPPTLGEHTADVLQKR